jgi:hypothetical protein
MGVQQPVTTAQETVMSDDLTMEQAGLRTPQERDRINRYIAAELLAQAGVMDIYADAADERARTADSASPLGSLTPNGWIGRTLAYETVANGLRARATELSPSTPDDLAEIQARLAELRGE